MKEMMQKLREAALQAILETEDVDSLESLRVKYLGKKGELTGILRQIMEPKIVSDHVKIHPLIVMAGIYLSIAAMNLWILFYVLALVLLYKILLLSGVFDTKPAE